MKSCYEVTRDRVTCLAPCQGIDLPNEYAIPPGYYVAYFPKGCYDVDCSEWTPMTRAAALRAVGGLPNE